jgi:hypothetical protein
MSVPLVILVERAFFKRRKMIKLLNEVDPSGSMCVLGWTTKKLRAARKRLWRATLRRHNSNSVVILA